MHLSGDESLLAAPTRYPGHYVAGRLTGRLGAHVELRPTEGSGITAYVGLPAAVLVEEAGVRAAT
ncbi:hypothetical protein [Streptomyces sp. NPDC023838]|uniref:hypothetical protein n=1 Tax=Streptomyces sp. NPDC023838 TaxID=3154325 RepID=UPI0033C06BE7